MQNVHFLPSNAIFSVVKAVEFLLDQVNLREIDGSFSVDEVKAAMGSGNADKEWTLAGSLLELEYKHSTQTRFVLAYSGNGSDFRFHFETDKDFPEGTVTINAPDFENGLVKSIEKWIKDKGYEQSQIRDEMASQTPESKETIEEENKPKEQQSQESVAPQAVQSEPAATLLPCGCPTALHRFDWSLDEANEFARGKRSHYAKKDRNPQIEILQCMKCDQFLAVQLNKHQTDRFNATVLPISEDVFLNLMQIREELNQSLDANGHSVFIGIVEEFVNKLEA